MSLLGLLGLVALAFGIWVLLTGGLILGIILIVVGLILLSGGFGVYGGRRL